MSCKHNIESRLCSSDQELTEHPRGAFSTKGLSTDRSGQMSLLDTEFLNNSGDCSAAGLVISVLLIFCKKA